jgi:hypothetical protein
MDMGGMSMGGVPPMEDFPIIYWGVIAGTIGTAAMVNMLICRQR